MRGILCDRFPLQLISFSAYDAEKLATDLKYLFQKSGQILSWEQIESSLTLYMQAVEGPKRMAGDDTPYVTISPNNLTDWDQTQGCDSNAESLFLQAPDSTKSTLDAHPAQLTTWPDNWARLEQDRRYTRRLSVDCFVLLCSLIGLAFYMLLRLMAAQSSQVLFWLMLVLMLGTIR